MIKLMDGKDIIMMVLLITSWLFFSRDVDATARHTRNQKIKINVAIMYSLSGDLAFISDTLTIAKFWQYNLLLKLQNDYSWPLDVSLEYYDVKSDPNVTVMFLEERIRNTSLGNLSAIIGPESELLGFAAARVASKYGIPCILAVTNGNSNSPTESSFLDTSFLIQPAPVYQFRSLIDSFVAAGVRSLVAVTLHEPYDLYNKNTCFGSAGLAASRGINVLAKISITLQDDADSILALMKKIKDTWNPDAIIWCDWASCAIPSKIKTFNPMPAFYKANYLPKALSLLDCLDHPGVMMYYDQGLFQYVSSGEFVSDKLRGPDYTEDDEPYSSTFRPKTSANFSVTDQLNMGWTAEFQSSTKLFMQWYRSVTNNTASYQTVASWAAFDVLEAALYRTAIDAQHGSDGFTPYKLLSALKSSQSATPFGRVIFESQHVNLATKPITVQALSSSSTTEIVAPSDQSTATFVYPMPNWSERIYKWRLIRDTATVVAVAISVVCSFVLLLLIVTVCVHRKENDVRMLGYMQVVSMCIAAMVCCWAITLLWQADVIEAQCKAYIWVITMPLSYIISLNNVKAYRMSLIVSAKFKKLKPFTHTKVLVTALLCTFATATALAAVTLTGMPQKILVQPDPYRPAFNYHYCQPNTATIVVVALLIVAHVLASVVCIVPIRNGLEVFRDGTVMKEAFVILYACMIFGLPVEVIFLDNSSKYLVRAVCVSVGVTLFCLRILIGRCWRHWAQAVNYIRISLYLLVKHAHKIQHRISKQMNYVLPDVTIEQIGVDALEDDEDEDGSISEPTNYLYSKATPTDSDLQEMFDALVDPDRCDMFQRIAEERRCMDKLKFIQQVWKFKSIAQPAVTQAIGSIALAIGSSRESLQHLLAAAEAVPTPTKRNFHIPSTAWGCDAAFPAGEQALALITRDFNGRVELYDETFKRTAVSLYQSVWNKFRIAETDCLAIGNAKIGRESKSSQESIEIDFLSRNSIDKVHFRT